MERSVLNKKIMEARRATSELVDFMNANDLQGWAKKFSELEAFLETGDTESAINFRKNLNYAHGPGSLSDLYVDDQKSFDRLLGLVEKGIGNIRMYIEYDVDRGSIYA